MRITYSKFTYLIHIIIFVWMAGSTVFCICQFYSIPEFGCGGMEPPPKTFRPKFRPILAILVNSGWNQNKSATLLRKGIKRKKEEGCSACCLLLSPAFSFLAPMPLGLPFPSVFSVLSLGGEGMRGCLDSLNIPNGLLGLNDVVTFLQAHLLYVFDRL